MWRLIQFALFCRIMQGNTSQPGCSLSSDQGIDGSPRHPRRLLQLFPQVRAEDVRRAESVQRGKRHLHVPQYPNQVSWGATENHVHRRPVSEKGEQAYDNNEMIFAIEIKSVHFVNQYIKMNLHFYWNVYFDYFVEIRSSFCSFIKRSFCWLKRPFTPKLLRHCMSLWLHLLGTER